MTVSVPKGATCSLEKNTNLPSVGALRPRVSEYSFLFLSFYYTSVLLAIFSKILQVLQMYSVLMAFRRMIEDIHVKMNH